MEQEEIIALEKKHALGYERQPQTDEEINEWEAEQVWGEYESEETE
jgi:hypothetical protein